MTREERTPSGPFRRRDPRASLKRDLNRLEHRELGDASFWRSLGVIGAVGWPIVIATVGGALAGRWLHAHWNTGFGLTALLVARWRRAWHDDRVAAHSTEATMSTRMILWMVIGIAAGVTHAVALWRSAHAARHRDGAPCGVCQSWPPSWCPRHSCTPCSRR